MSFYNKTVNKVTKLKPMYYYGIGQNNVKNDMVNSGFVGFSLNILMFKTILV